MRTFRGWNLVATAVAILSATAAFAENPGQGQGGRISGASPNDQTYLLASASVQNELALNDDQKASLQQLRNNEENGDHPFFGGFAGQPQQQIQRRIDEHAKFVRSQIAAILSPQQLERLSEINIQVVGVAALGYDDVADKLNLTADQKDQLKTVGDDTRQKLTEINSTFTSGKPVSDQQRLSHKQQQSEITTERNSKALAILTDEQKSEFAKLQGDKFDISTIQANHRSFNRRGRTAGTGVATASKQ